MTGFCKCDICPNCLEEFCNWIKTKKAELKHDDFPMNKPE